MIMLSLFTLCFSVDLLYIVQGLASSTTFPFDSISSTGSTEEPGTTGFNFERDYILAIWKERSATYEAANQYCEDTYGTELGTMNTLSDYRAAYDTSYFGGFNGLHDLDGDGQFEWMDGTACDIDGAFCTQWYDQTSYDADLEGGAGCTIIPWGGYIVKQTQCNATYTQYYCRKPTLTEMPRDVRTYHVVELEKTYRNALKHCRVLYDTELATIITEEEFSNALRDLYYFEEGWIGLRRQSESKGYRWKNKDDECTVDDGSGDCVSYWNEYDPNEPEFDCGLLWQNGRGKTKACDETTAYFICNGGLQTED